MDKGVCYLWFVIFIIYYNHDALFIIINMQYLNIAMTILNIIYQAYLIRIDYLLDLRIFILTLNRLKWYLIDF
jgi:hypothetical protein